ncbi:3-hydroxyacyl-CoA dehydrogenase [Sphingomonas vulcanisoli]|uniref:3-hydroxyacyl-CoA dehydrogenase n=1 Tax=Sphingomonas vulcanisoli TaxID=1658060 RepID=A0ABX0TYI9_9SPHN|nr:3-hydroxyacyl-CoA dehydrogenase [Sphingomonas vulcanisoli]
MNTPASTVSRWEVRDRVALLTIDNPPVNALSQAVRIALFDAIAAISADESVDALVIACAGRTFIAGADLREFGKPATEPFLTQVVDAIEASAKPVVAAIHGSALGGGLEVAMACHYRIAAPKAQFGLPEVKLGLMPGARGTQHLPRLIGADEALPMIAFGNSIGADKALSLGLIDRIAGEDLVADAIAFARSIADKPVPRRRDRNAALTSPTLFEDFPAANARKFRGLDAPPAIVEAVRAAVELPFEEGAKREREVFLKLREGPQTLALRHLFFAEREAAKVPGLDGVDARPIATVGVIGAGTMGTGIAINFLIAGLPVTLMEANPEALERGAATIAKTLADNAKSGRMTQAAADTAQALLSRTLIIDDLGSVDLVIEAAFETMEVKTAIFSALGKVAKPNAILATNTSYLDVDAIAAASGRPADVIGLHFFSPANIMKLLEIVRGRATADDVLATGLALAKRIRKTPVVSGNAYGFIGNRLLAVRRREAEAMLAEGVSPYAIDAAIEAFGFPMGPFRIGDLAGLDLGWSAETSTGATIRERLCEAGRRGQKTGAGFYDYDEKRRPSPSPQAIEIVERFAAEKGATQREVTADAIVQRLLWPMVAEGALILREGIAQRLSDIDVVWTTGYGWPAWTGGPMHYGKTIGFRTIADALESMGDYPTDALRELADEKP